MTKSRLLLSVVACAVALSASSMPVSAHAAAPPPAYMTRIINDYSDDWVSTSFQGQALSPHDGHDLIALDAYTQYNASLGGDVLVFRLVLNGGYMTGSSQPELAEHITFKANGKDQELAVNTEDNQEFAVEVGFSAVRGPFVQPTADGTTPDGTRFFVEGLVNFTSLGLKAGDSLSDFFVQGEAGDGDGDAMPQYDAAGPVPDVSGDTIHSNIGTWQLPAPSYYFSAAIPANNATVPVAGEFTVAISVSNLVNDTQQTVTAMAMGDGLLTSFTGKPTAAMGMGSLDIAGGKTASITLHVARDPVPPSQGMGNESKSAGSSPSSSASTHSHSASMSGSAAPVATMTHTLLTVELTSSLGGHLILPVHLDVQQPAPAPQSASMSSTHAESKKSPSPTVPVLAGGLAMLAVAIRRRR